MTPEQKAQEYAMPYGTACKSIIAAVAGYLEMENVQEDIKEWIRFFIQKVEDAENKELSNIRIAFEDGYAAKEEEDGWISVDDRLPQANKSVWMCNPQKGHVWMGCYLYIPGETPGYLWANQIGELYSKNREIIVECYPDDDLDVTHWKYAPTLPSPPKTT